MKTRITIRVLQLFWSYFSYVCTLPPNRPELYLWPLQWTDPKDRYHRLTDRNDRKWVAICRVSQMWCHSDNAIQVRVDYQTIRIIPGKQRLLRDRIFSYLFKLFWNLFYQKAVQFCWRLWEHSRIQRRKCRALHQTSHK